MPDEKREHILVIKLSALGDFIQALGPMAAIRRHHPNARITLLTTKPFEDFGQACGYFNQVILDRRPKLLDITGWMDLRKKLNAGGFTRVYDLQNNDRTALYFKLFRKTPEWVGAAPGASHRNASPERSKGHAFDGHKQTLALAGISGVEIDDLSWMQADTDRFDLKRPYVLLVPGCAPNHPEKRWPAGHYVDLARHLAENKIQPVILGTKDDAAAAAHIYESCPGSINLAGRTSLADIAVLARHASGAVGNDTGPMHMIAATGCPAVSLFSGQTIPEKHGPRGKDVTIIQKQPLSDLKAAGVIDVLEKKIQRD